MFRNAILKIPDSVKLKKKHMGKFGQQLKMSSGG